MTRTNKSSPLTFDVEGDTLLKIEALKQKNGRRTNTAVVVDALRNFDFSKANVSKNNHRQFSVRLDGDLKERLKEEAKANEVSLGALVRLAILKLADEELGANDSLPESAPHPERVNPADASPSASVSASEPGSSPPKANSQPERKKAEEPHDEWWKI